jgi:small-conductance mechanosensitive channel
MDPQAVDVNNLGATLTALRDQAILFLPRLAIGMVIFFIFWVVNRILRRLIQRIGKSTELPEEVCSLAADVVGLTAIGFGIITALGTMGINVGAMIAGLGLTGFALAFALQDIVSSTLAGILLLVFRPFSVGHLIRVSGNEGIVSDINLRYTRLNNDGNTILIPNSTLFKEAIIVYGDSENPHPVKLIGEKSADDSKAPASTVPPRLPQMAPLKLDGSAAEQKAAESP